MKPPKQPPSSSAPSDRQPKRRPAGSRPRIDEAAPQGEADGNRIAKVLARAGLCSRRDAERWIEEGRVAVNDTVLTSPAFNVGPRDRVTVDGEPLPERERTRLWLYHKPRGLVTTARDPEGRPTVFDNLPEHLPRVIAVGRLDINTEGLLLLTNDGGLARVLELPSTGWLRRYRARAWGEVMQPDLDRLRDGVTIDGMMYGAIDAALERVQGSNVWINLALREGKNREVKNVLANLGLDVNRLIRISYGPFQLGDLAEGEVVEIRGRVLRDQLGEKLAAEAGVDFDAPVRQGEREEPAPRAPPPARKPASPRAAASDAAPRSRAAPAKIAAKAAGKASGKPRAEDVEEAPRRRGRPISDRRRLAYEREEKDAAERVPRRFAEASATAEPDGERGKQPRPARSGGAPSGFGKRPAGGFEGRDGKPGRRAGGKTDDSRGGLADSEFGGKRGGRSAPGGKPAGRPGGSGGGKPRGPAGSGRPDGDRPKPSGQRPRGPKPSGPKPGGAGGRGAGGRGADRRR